MPLPPALQPTPLELAAGTVVGWAPPEPLPDVPASLTPLEALQDALVPALERGRCCVAFSGGRDSSAILAAAVDAARARGLDDPVPLTMRFPGAEASLEDRWQEEVVAHLGLSDWHRVEIAGDLDFVGPHATAVLRRHGSFWPANGHSYLPLFAWARGGTLVTGLDGDGLLDGWQWGQVAAVLGGRRRPSPRDALRVVKAHSPRPLRRAWAARRERAFDRLSWLTPDAREQINRAFVRQRAEEPPDWRRRLGRYYLGQRHLAVIGETMQMTAADAEVAMAHPLLDRRFLAAFARAGGRAGYADRTEAMGVLFGGLLPRHVVERRSKAEFSGAFWGEASRVFAESWSGRGLDPALVDAERLRAAWLSPSQGARSACLLQQAWLADSGVEAQE